jgi:hypothetical protein
MGVMVRRASTGLPPLRMAVLLPHLFYSDTWKIRQ